MVFNTWSADLQVLLSERFHKYDTVVVKAELVVVVKAELVMMRK
jgi:hypothetical protein